MRLYRLVYQIKGGSDQILHLLQEEYEKYSEKDNYLIFQAESEEFYTKKYKYDKAGQRVIEICRPTQKYLQLYCIIIFYTIFNLFNIGPSGIVLDIVSLSAGLGGIGLFLYPLVLPHKKPEFFQSRKSLNRLFGTPILIQSKFRVTFLSIFLSAIILYNLYPWVIPRLNIFLGFLCTIVIGTIVLASRGDTDPITGRVIVLSGLVASFIAPSFMNLFIFTQYNAYKSQDLALLTMYEPFYTNMDITQIYHVVMPEPLTLIIIVNVLFLFFLLSISNFILDNIKDISRFETPESVLTDSIDIRYGMSLVLLIYIAYHMYFLLAFLSGDGIIENLDYWEFLMAYLPSLWILAWVIFWLGRSIQLRQNLVTNIDEGQKFESKKKLDLVIADTGTHRAIPVNLVGRKPVVLINSSLADELTDSEIKAVYYHEVYHITEDQQNLRRLIRLPVIGYLIALWFINPINAYRKELEADQYAAKKAGVEETASAIKTVGQMQAKMSESPKSVSRAQATLSLFKLVWSVPVFSLYRPSREQRIKELRGT